MKKKLLAIVLMGLMTFSLVACGAEEAPAAAPAPAAQEEAAEKPAEEEPEEVVEEAEAEAVSEEAEEGEAFSLLDVSTDMIQFGIYAVAEDGTENVIAGFNGPDGNSYIMLMIVPQEGEGDVVCGSVTADTVATLTDDDGVEWSAFNFIDAYTGTDCTAVFADFDDGSVMISNVDLSYAIAGQYLTAEETIAFMAAAVQYIQ